MIVFIYKELKSSFCIMMLCVRCIFLSRSSVVGAKSGTTCVGHYTNNSVGFTFIIVGDQFNPAHIKTDEKWPFIGASRAQYYSEEDSYIGGASNYSIAKKIKLSNK